MKREVTALTVAFMVILGCGESRTGLSREELLNPETCKTCHAEHYREWSGSMHAYAAEDPVFLAMNRRGQRETNGALGDFCVQCHAPMAVREGATIDGLNLEELPAHLKGVTCYFCHNVEAVEGTHNNPLRLANDTVMRGGIADPVGNDAHASAYSPFLDRRRTDSSALCGACHDIVTPAGVDLERTYLEWQDSVYSQESRGHQNCGMCHMDGRSGVVADVPGVPVRRMHAHTFPGVDLALTDFPEREEQRRLVQSELDKTLLAEVCVFDDPDADESEIRVTLENIAAGHMFPSGAAQDRRAWVEVVAYVGDEVVFASGVVPDGEPVALLTDPHLWLLRDRVFDAEGGEAHMFWDVRRYESNLLPAPVTLDLFDPRYLHSRTQQYPVPRRPDRVTIRVRMRPMGLEVLDDLVRSGDLASEIRDRVPTFTLRSTVHEWVRGGLPCAGGEYD